MSKQIRATTAALATSLALSLSGCGYNTFQSADEQIKAGWAEVINEYQRRADLIPSLGTAAGPGAQHHAGDRVGLHRH